MVEKTRSKVYKRFVKAMIGMDDVCANIYVILYGTKRLRVNELYRALCTLHVKITKETLYIHLGHLKKNDLVRSEAIGKQNVSFALADGGAWLKRPDETTVERWVKTLENWHSRKTKPRGLPAAPRWKPFDAREHYEKLPEKQLEDEIEGDLKEAVFGNLSELKALIDVDLEDDNLFWKVIGNPLFRLFEKSVAENCRVSNRYREKFFKRLDLEIEKYK
jgi:hypothetical protein